MNAPVNEPLISAHGLSVSYRARTGILRSVRRQVLHDVHIQVYRGESLAVVGRNGSGKTTLLRVLARLIEADEGWLKVTARRIGMLSLQAGFQTSLTGVENIYLNGLLLGFPRRDIRALIPAIRDFSELGQALDNPVGTYSAGMRARLGFSVGLHLRPDVLIIDEVLAVGDEAFRRKSADAMQARMRSDQTIVLVSHSAQVVRDLCDRAVLLDQGRVVTEGETAAVLREYARLRNMEVTTNAR